MISFTTGTINQPDAGSVGLAMVEKIRDDVVAHAAWDLVEEFTPSGGAVRWYVFKCLASVSGLASDFFVVIGRTLSNGELRFAIGEGYDSATDTFSLFAPASQFVNIAYDATGRCPGTMVLGTTQFDGSPSKPKYSAWVPSGVSTKWWLSVAEDGFTVAFNGPSNGFVHLGAYTPYTDSAIALALQIIGANEQYGAITRNPAVASTSAYGYACTMDGGGNPSPVSGATYLGFRGPAQYNDKLQSNQRTVAEQGITIAQTLSNSPELWGFAVGKQKRMRVAGGTPPSGFAFGDAYALDGNLWVPYLPTDQRMWDTGVAA
jgi:hypothetical protein